MAKSWYLSLNGRELGPLPSEQVQRMAARGQIKTDTLIRPETQEEWLPAKTWPQLFAADSAATTPQVTPATPPRGTAVVPRGKAIPTGSAAAVVTPPQGSIPQGSVPRGTPAGVAVGTPVPPVAPAGLPVGSPVKVAASQPAGFPPIIVTDAGAPRTNSKSPATDDDDAHGTTKKKNRTPVLVLGGVAVAIALVGGLLVAFNPFTGGEQKKSNTATNTLAAATKGPEADPAAAEGEIDPAVKNVEADAAPSTAKGSANGAKAVGASSVSSKATDELKKKVKAWKSAANTYKIASLRYQVTGAWFANEASADSAKPDSAPASDATSDSAKPKYLCVQVTLTNVGQAPLTYRGWNGLAAKDAAAVLLDSEGAVLPLAPAAELAAERLKSVSISPKETVVDTLVFAAPQGEIESLKIIMPQVAVSGVGTGVFALEIPAAMVSAERPKEEPLGPGRNVLAGKPARPESEFDRERRRLAESLGGDPTDMPNEPKVNEPKVNEPKSAKPEPPDSDMPEKPAANPKPEGKEAKPGEPSLKDLINGPEKKPDGTPGPEKPKSE